MCYCVFALLLTLAMKRIEDDMLHFLEWLADNHEDALRLGEHYKSMVGASCSAPAPSCPLRGY